MIKIDEINLKILRALQANAKLTNLALSKLVGLSPSPCLDRVKKLEKEAVV
jgi:DNA-binding Lrp family transcriptional regulator